jgi:hypothetical protein
LESDYYFYSTCLLLLVNYIIKLSYLNQIESFNQLIAAFQNFAPIEKIVLNAFLFLLFFYKLLSHYYKVYSSILYILVLITELTISSYFILPITAISKTRSSQFKENIRFSSIDNHDLLSKVVFYDTTNNYELGHYYNKRVSFNSYYKYIGITKRYDQWIQSTHEKNEVLNHPFLYFQNDSSIHSIDIMQCTNNKIKLRVYADQNDTLNITQQYHHNWHAIVNNIDVQIFNSSIAFMSIDVPKGISIIELNYKPNLVILLMYISIFVCISLVLFNFIFFRNTII